MRIHDLRPGQCFGRLEVIREIVSNGFKQVLCKCDCGNATTVCKYDLLREGPRATRSCGCLRQEMAARLRYKDLTDKVFTRLKVIHKDNSIKIHGITLWICECNCGNFISVRANDLLSGNTKSCGCLRAECTTSLSSYNEQHHFIEGVFVPLLRQKLSSNNKTGAKGVSIRRIKSGQLRYVVTIAVKRQRHYIGTFHRLDDAIHARKKAELKYHKPYLDKFM